MSKVKVKGMKEKRMKMKVMKREKEKIKQGRKILHLGYSWAWRGEAV